ncbi:hypothetical protein ATK36_5086 [Amycolatopsis sulphurea]|uniref:PE family protein n=1 Tax=Amycolatopsis sulphurea TaxID=76022 RepID=A0A2A9FEU3_9PSEU|nr:hypothetical protein ATK36_5086 [Amycolatopsis sulphurea]
MIERSVEEEGHRVPNGQGPSGHAGYITPEELARRKAEQAASVVVPNPAAVVSAAQNAVRDVGVNAAVAGGRFEMDLDAMKALLPEWEAIADKLGDMCLQAQPLPGLRQPAEDPGSTVQIRAARSHALAYLASVQQQFVYAQGYVGKLKTAIDNYEKQEHTNTDAVRKQG